MTSPSTRSFSHDETSRPHPDRRPPAQPPPAPPHPSAAPWGDPAAPRRLCRSERALAFPPLPDGSARADPHDAACPLRPARGATPGLRRVSGRSSGRHRSLGPAECELGQRRDRAGGHRRRPGQGRRRCPRTSGRSLRRQRGHGDTGATVLASNDPVRRWLRQVEAHPHPDEPGSYVVGLSHLAQQHEDTGRAVA